MAVAMASGGIVSGLCSGVRVIEKQPISIRGVLRGSFELGSVHRIGIVPKR